MKRREFITLIGGAVAAWPLAARAQQQPDRVRRIGVLIGAGADFAEASNMTALQQGLQELGWVVGRSQHTGVTIGQQLGALAQA